jgi:asparagine synthase (glutamine-hydrolysing)
MTSFTCWISHDRNSAPDPGKAARLADRMVLAYDGERSESAMRGLAWCYVGRPGASEQRPGQAVDEAAEVSLTVFGPVFDIAGSSVDGLSRDEVAGRVLARYDGDPGRWLEGISSHAGFVLVDGRRDRTIVARDQMGAQPLFWRQGKGGVALANSSRPLIELDGRRSSPDRARIARFLVEDVSVSDACGTSFSYLEDVSRVMPGHLLVIENGEVRQQQYFDIADYFSREKFDKPDAEAYKALLTAVIASQAGNPETTGVTLSGGLDSPAIALLLSQLFGPDRALNTISMGNMGQGADESANVRSVLDDIRAAPRWVVPDESQIFDTLKKTHLYLETPLFSPSPAIFMLLKQTVADAGLHQVFGGLGADEALGGLNMGFLRDLLTTGQIRRFWSEVTAARDVNAMRQNLTRLGLVREHVYDPLRSLRPPPVAPAWVNPALAREFGLKGGRPTRPQVAGLDCFDGRNAAILTRTFTQSFLHYEAQLGIAWGVENRFPYLDPRTVSYAARLPWHEKFSKGLYKHHHRRAFQGMFPEKIAMQQKKSLIPAVHDHWLRIAAREPVRAVIEGGGGWTDYLDAGKVREEYRAYVASEDEVERNRLRRSTWRALTLDMFLTSLQ